MTVTRGRSLGKQSIFTGRAAGHRRAALFSLKKPPPRYAMDEDQMRTSLDSMGIILGILAGIKPLEEAYRARNQSCRLKIDAAVGALTPDQLKQELGVRAAQIKRFLVNPNGSNEEISVLLAKVSSEDIKTFMRKLNERDRVNSVSVVNRKRGAQVD
jgi:hypothetical protein